MGIAFVARLLKEKKSLSFVLWNVIAGQEKHSEIVATVGVPALTGARHERDGATAVSRDKITMRIEASKVVTAEGAAAVTGFRPRLADRRCRLASHDHKGQVGAGIV